MPLFEIEYEAHDKMHTIIIKAKSESAAISKLERLFIQQGLESEAEVYRIEEVE